MKIGNTNLIPQNVAPPGATKVVVCANTGEVVCECDLGNLAMPVLGEKLYSVGLLSDTHTALTSAERAEDSQRDLARAIGWLAANADMTCICGDLVSYNSEVDADGRNALAVHKGIVDSNRGNMEVYEIAGNHEHQAYPSGSSTMSESALSQYTDRLLYYTVSSQPTDITNRNYYSPHLNDNDIFVMVGSASWSSVFSSASWAWFTQTLEANKNKRCFVCMHCFLKGEQYCGDSTGLVNTVDMTASYKQQLISAFQQYPNVIYFHGHSHVMANMQTHLESLESPLPANYDFACGVHSIHIPSLALPRDISGGSASTVVTESQGCTMDVYAKHIVLRYWDFNTGETGGQYNPPKNIPIANYCIETN